MVATWIQIVMCEPDMNNSIWLWMFKMKYLGQITISLVNEQLQIERINCDLHEKIDYIHKELSIPEEI